MKFGNFLVEQTHITKVQVQEALAIQATYRKKKLGRILVELGHLSQDQLNNALQKYMKANHSFSVIKAKAQMAKIRPCKEILEITKKYKTVQINETKDHIEFAALKFEDQFIEQIENQTKKNISIRIVEQESFGLLSHTSSSRSKRQMVVLSRILSDDDKLNGQSPYCMIFKDLLGRAKSQGASDIHIEPTGESVKIRFRRHGFLSDIKALGGEHREPFITTVKNIINLNLAIIGRPQDSRASFKTFKLDLRANSLPTLHGEKIVLRLLDQERNFNLSDAGLSKEAQSELKSAISKRDGLVLISGPTGSGKTTTLYSLLREIDCNTKNVSTLENPVEYELLGINQVNIKEEGRLSFANALRALMRQDPDVILIGEIRDEETAKLAFKAAATGHLALSTVHANNSVAVIERLLGLGVDALTIRESLRLSCAQRLVPLLCQQCSVLSPRQHMTDYLARLKIKKEDHNLGAFRQKNEKGCSECQEGITGRRAILEYMTKEHIEKFTSGGEGPFVYQSLQDEAFDLAKSGKVDLREVFEIA